MAQLFPPTTQKADVPLTAEERRKIQAAGEVHRMATEGLFHATPARNTGVENVLGGIGLAQRAAQAPVTAAKAETAPTLHHAVAALQRSRSIAPKAAETLSLIVKSHEAHRGETVAFSNDELGAHLRISAKDAGEIVDDLQRAGLIRQRTNALGAPVGFAPTLPR